MIRWTALLLTGAAGRVALGSFTPVPPKMPDDTPRPDPDEDLVTRAQEGDTRAFDALILKYGEKLYGLIYNMTSNKEDTHDLLQDVFARAYHSLPKFKGKSTFYTWIYQIAVNMTLNFLKKRKRRTGLSLNEMDSSVHQDPALVDTGRDADPERQANVHELQKRLNEAMQSLSESHRTVVTLFDVQGLPHAEIAKILKVSVGTVRSRLHYAHQHLQTYLQDFWEQRF
ncbi:sigma-70 family RNA polymerase sigma factor [Haloferula helveola]|uniref:sigma-70 family RNA polymerase sigma factor n=1 Tax=Haloferula helveola TaxID=490095 RepID=UPI0030CACA75